MTLIIRLYSSRKLGIKKSHVTMAIVMIWPVHSDCKGWFSNPIESTCKHLIVLKTETSNYCACAVTWRWRKWLMMCGISCCCCCRVKCHKWLLRHLKFSFHSSPVKWSSTTSHQSLIQTLIHRHLCFGRGNSGRFYSLINISCMTQTLICSSSPNQDPK